MNHSRQNYQDFHLRYCKAELLKQTVEGNVFMGNTRAGKSTLSSAASGGRMEIHYDIDEKKSYLEPTQENMLFRDVIKHSISSVTEQPNFFPISNTVANIDMPGYADSSKVRQMINFHYIKTMLSNLQRVRFFMVIEVKNLGKEFEIDSHELLMMENFMEMFPDCQDNLSIIINKVDSHNRNKQFETNLKHYYRKMLTSNSNEHNHIKRHVKNPTEFNKYYIQMVNKQRRLHLVRRPPFIVNGKAQPYDQIRTTMSNIIRNDNSQFKSTDQLQYVNIDIFNQGKINQNKQLCETLLQVIEQIEKNIRDGTSKLKQFMTLSLQIACGDQAKKSKLTNEIQSVLGGLFEKNKDNLKNISLNGQPIKLKLLQNSCMRMLETILQRKKQIEYKEKNGYKEYMDIIEQKEKCQRERINKLFSSFLNVCANTQLQKQIQRYFSLFTRNYEELFFIWKTSARQIGSKIQQKFQKLEDKDLFPQLSKISLKSKSIEDYIYDLLILGLDPSFQQSTNSLVQNFFLEFKPEMFKELYCQNFVNECVGSLEIIRKLYRELSGKDQTEQIKQKINRKIKQIKQYWIILPYPNPHPKEVLPLKKMLETYNLLESKEDKFKLAVKIVHTLELAKEYKKALGLFVYLQFYEKMMKTLSLIVQSKECKREDSLEYYFQIGMQLSSIDTIYFEFCMQQAKSYSFHDVSKLLQIKEALSKKRNDKGILSRDFNWKKIDSEINFLRFKQGIDTKQVDVVLKRLRYRNN